VNVRVHAAVLVRCPVERVFEFVTTPGNWSAWHPSSRGVRGATGDALTPGEEITEELLVAGRRGRVTWRLRAREGPRRWVIEGQVEGGEGGTIEHTMTPDAGGTWFEWEFRYTVRRSFPRVLDRLLVRPRIAAESARALRRLKRALESG